MPLTNPPDPNPDNRPRTAAIAALALTALAIWLAAASLTDLWGPDESRYVQVGKELLGRGNWFLMQLHGEPYNQKPPLPFWILAAMVKLGGGAVSSILTRLPGILLGLVALISTYAIGRRRFDEATGLLAAIMLATTAVFMENAPLAKLDMPLAGWTTLAAAAWLTRARPGPISLARAALFWGAIAGAFFVKGPLALLIVLPIVAGEAWARRSWEPLRSMRAGWGMLALALLIFGWFYGEARGAGWGFVRQQIFGQTVDRVMQGDHEAPFYYYLLRSFTSIFVPWVYLLIPLAFTFRKRRETIRELAPELCWFVIPFIIFTLANGKRQTYLLPLAPPVALLAAWQARRFIEAGLRLPRWTQAIGALLAFAGLALIAATIVFVLKPAMLQKEMVFFRPLHYLQLWLIGLLIATLGVRLLRSAGDFALLIMTVAAVSALAFAGLSTVFDPARNMRRSTRDFTEQVQEIADAEKVDLVGGLGDGGRPEYDVYARYRVVELDDKPAIFADPEKLPRLIVGKAGDWKHVTAAAASAGYVELVSRDVAGDPMTLMIRRRTAAP